MENILILDCDLDRGRDNTAKAIEDILKDKNFTRFRVCENIFPKNISQFTHIIITGSDADVYDDRKWIRKLEKLIKQIHNERIRILGICFGHQLIAKVLGCSIVKGEKEVGIYKLKKHHINNNILLKNISEMTFFEYHSWYIKDAPEGARILASNKLCIQAIEFDDHTCGVQFHPEVNISLATRFLKPEGKKIKFNKYQEMHYDLERKNIFNNFIEI